MSIGTEQKRTRERKRLHAEYDAERDKDSARSDREMAVKTQKRKEQVSDIADKLEAGKALAVRDMNLLATAAVRLEYMQELRKRNHNAEKFADMFDILSEIAKNAKVTPQNRIKAANAYIARTREIAGLTADEKDQNRGTTIIFNVDGDLIAGGKRNQDPVQPVREAKVSD